MGKDFNVSLYFLSCLQSVTLGFLFVTTVTKALTTNPKPLLSVTKGHTEKNWLKEILLLQLTVPFGSSSQEPPPPFFFFYAKDSAPSKDSVFLRRKY